MRIETSEFLLLSSIASCTTHILHVLFEIGSHVWHFIKYTITDRQHAVFRVVYSSNTHLSWFSICHLISKILLFHIQVISCMSSLFAHCQNYNSSVIVHAVIKTPVDEHPCLNLSFLNCTLSLLEHWKYLSVV